MYCGDETGSFIGEIGSHSCRFGYGGEDNPKLVVPSYVNQKGGGGGGGGTMAASAVSTRLAQQEMESILRRPDYSTSNLTDPNAFLRQGDLVEKWDNLQTAWETGMEVLHAKDTFKHTKGGTPYSTNVGASPSSEGKCVHPILAITPGFTQFDGYGASYCASVKRQQQIQYTELLIEQMEASSLFLAPAPMLAAFSLGRQTALVVDIGAGGTRVTPVVDGLLLQQAQRRNGRGGDWLGHVTWKALLEEKMTPKPRYLLRDTNNGSTLKASKSPLFHTWAMHELMYELRTEPFVKLDVATPSSYDGTRRIPFTPVPSSDADGEKDVDMEDAAEGLGSPPPTPGSVASAASTAAPSMYEFPDGTLVDLTHSTLGKDLTRIPELLFAKTLPFTDTDARSTTPLTNNLQTLGDAPLHELIHQSLLAVEDVDIRKELSSNILLTGGSSLFPNLDARLSHELTKLLPAFTKPKVVAPRFSVERTHAAWIGASILTSLGSFQQLWLSRTEYEEYGATMAIQRFP
jgi:actin-like protein 6A